jgi:acyl carrier protein
MQANDIGDRIRNFISTELLYEEDGSKLTNDTPLLGAAVDSLGLMQLLRFIEEEFDVTIDDSEVTATNFRTIADIERLITEKAQVG